MVGTFKCAINVSVTFALHVFLFDRCLYDVLYTCLFVYDVLYMVRNHVAAAIVTPMLLLLNVTFSNILRLARELGGSFCILTQAVHKVMQ